MTTTIVPASGQGILFAQQGPGTTPGYAALDVRRAASGPLQEGVYGTSTLVTAGGVSNVGQADFMVTQRAAGANMSVDVNMPAGGFAWVQGDTINGQALYEVPVHASNINEVIATADATNPRIDQIILEIQDNVLDASGGNIARTRVLTGTPTGGATLGNRSGALALPGSALLLADVLVGNGVTTLGNAVMRDRRKWARGASAFLQVNMSSTALGAGAYTTLTALNQRIECSGVPLLLSLDNAVFQVGTATTGVLLSFTKDGTTYGISVGNTVITANQNVLLPWKFVDSGPAAGSHLFAPAIDPVNAGTLQAGFVQFYIREVIAQNTANNTVTTG